MAILFRNGRIVFDGGSIVFLEGNPDDCRCCGCPCRDDLANSYTVTAPCISWFEGDDCDGVDTWSVTVSRPLPTDVSRPIDAVGDCVWWGENECGEFLLWLDTQCRWRLDGLADPKESGDTPVGTYPNYVLGSGSVEVSGGGAGEEGI